MFPPGLPGLALLLLRASVGIALISECFLHRSSLALWIQAVNIAFTLLICIGFFTPVAAGLTLAIHLLIWFFVGLSHFSIVCVISLDAVALSLLGPGAYSLDAHRFGRRVVVLPSNPDSKAQGKR
jgi:putative oxidoreductase